MNWLGKCNPIHSKKQYPIHKKCLVCGKNTKKEFFFMQWHTPKGKFRYDVVHLDCFQMGEFKFNNRTKTIYWSYVGGLNAPA